jgi:hypothetical protein
MATRVNPFFTPTQISGCQLWLDAADTTTLTLSGSSVTQWRDKSGNGRNATGYNTTATFNPNGLNAGYSALEFSATKSMQSPVPLGTFSSAASGFIIYKFTGSVNLTAAYGLFSRTVSPSNGVPTPFDMYSFSNATYRSIGNGTVFTQSSASPNYITQTNASQYNFSVQSTATTTWNESVNGTFTTLTTSGGTGAGYGDIGSNVMIGGRLDTAVFFQGVISEVILYNISITTLQRQQIEGYLAWKWGLQSSLPANHPYKNSPIAPLINPPTTLPLVLQNTQAAFVPTQITGCQLWLDGADPNGTGVLPANNGTVSTWADKSGRGNNGTTTAGTLPYSTQSRGVVFNGSSYYTVPNNTFPTGNTNYSFFIVASTGLANYYWFLGAGSTTAGQAIGYVIYPNGTIENGWWTTNFTTAAGTVLANQTTMLESIYSSPTLTTVVNGSSRASSSSLGVRNNPAGPNLIGARPDSNPGSVIQAFVGVMNELILFASGVSLPQQQQVEGYLAWKWGLQENLPLTHPYKTGPPYSVSLPAPTRSLATSGFWRPTQISGSQLWLDAADTATLSLSGTSVSQWNDKSGSGNNATQGTASWRPSYGRVNRSTAIVFTGSPTFLYLPNITSVPLTLFMVSAATQNINNTFFVSLGSLFMREQFSPDVFGIDASVGAQYLSGVRDLNTHLWSFSLPASASGVFAFDGTVVSTSGFTFSANTTFGTNSLGTWAQNSANGNINGGISEILMYNSALTTEQRQKVEGYLAWKWGLQANLPANHPWKRWPPPP